MLNIRSERPKDIASIRDVNTAAFGQPQEADIVDALRAHGAVLLSLVATIDERIVGHILFSPATIDGVAGAALGPMAVVPERQRRGIGSALVEAGEQMLRNAGCPFVVVLGHRDFYPKFGFRPASTHAVRCEWNVPDEVFMLLVLDDDKMRNVSGVAKYRDEFSSAI